MATRAQRRPRPHGRRIVGPAGGAAVAGLVVLAAAWPGRAQQPEPTLHEFIDPPVGGGVADPRGAEDPSDTFGADPAAGRNPAGFRRGAKILPRPDTEVTRGDREPIHGRSEFGADRDTEWRADTRTGPDGTLRYVEVFNPSVVPFKRMTALDAVRDDYTLHVYDTSLQDLPVGGALAADRDPFWGSVAVQLGPGRDVPIPSVAPDMRIVSYQVEPPTQLVFSKDGADNYYVRSDEAGATGTYRVVFLADADARYFVPTVPRGTPLAAADRRHVRQQPPEIEAVAQRAARRLGIDRRTDLRDAVDALVTYFRQFEAKPPPPASGDVFWDLFSNQAGVCRHRAFAFSVVANAVGIPTRYVANEAHAWVEIRVAHAPGDAGWMRIDLGGAAMELQVHNTADKSMHQPRGEGNLPSPAAYADNYTRLEGNIQGLSPEQLAEAHSPSPESAGDLDLPPRSGPPASSSGPVGPGASVPRPSAEAGAGKVRTRLVVTAATATGFRGEALQVEGRLLMIDGRLGVGGQSIDVYLAPSGYGGDYATLVGRAVTGDDGAFAARVPLGLDLELTDYEIYTAYAGDEAYAPAVSD